MLKKRKGIPFRISLMSFIIMILILGCSLTVCAESNVGVLYVELQDLKTSNSDRKDVEVLIYKVGTVSEEGVPTLDTAEGPEEYPKDADLLEKTAEKLAEEVKGEPAERGRTDENGRVRFIGIDLGVYLVTVPGPNEYGNVTPFLVPIPYCPEVDGVVQEPQFIVTAEPKASPIETPDDDHKKPEKPEETPEKTPGTETVTENGPGQNGGKAKTGDETGISSFLLLAVLSLGGAILSINYRRNRL